MKTMVDIESRFSQIFLRFIRQMKNKIQVSIEREVCTGLDKKLSILRKLKGIPDLNETITPIITSLDE